MSKELEEKLLQQNKEIIATWNNLVDHTQNILPGVFHQRTLANLPTLEEMAAMNARIDERRNEIGKIGRDIKAKLTGAYIDHMQVRPTGDKFVDDLLLQFEKNVEMSLKILTNQLYIEYPVGEDHF